MERRLLSHLYDSNIQHAFVRWGDEATFRIMLGRLRLDTALYDRVVLIDADLFDGAFFLDAASRHDEDGRLLLSELPWEKIELRLRSPSLRESFFHQICKPGEERLVPCFFSSIPAGESKGIADHLGKMTAAGICTLKDTKNALVSAGMKPSIAEIYLTSWERFISFVETQQVSRVRWGGGFDFDQQIGAQRAFVERELSDFGYELFQHVWEERKSRNAVMPLLVDRSPVSLEEKRDIATIFTWYETAYKVSQHNQHQCNSMEVVVPKTCRQFNQAYLPVGEALEDIDPKDCLGVPSDLLFSIGALPCKEWKNILDSPYIANRLASWRATYKADDLFRAMTRLVRCLDQHRPFLDHRSRSLKADGEYLGGSLGNSAATLIGALIGGDMAHTLTQQKFWIAGAAIGAGYLSRKLVSFAFPPSEAEQRANCIVKMEGYRLRN